MIYFLCLLFSQEHLERIFMDLLHRHPHLGDERKYKAPWVEQGDHDPSPVTMIATWAQSIYCLYHIPASIFLNNSFFPANHCKEYNYYFCESIKIDVTR